ncbi:MAG TPA: IS4 family transposase, partial [Clostridia bacterium]
GWAETKATYRLLDNNKVTSEAILMSHKRQTIERMRKYDTVLCVQDTTSLDFSDHPATEGLGLYSDSETAKGLLMHTTMAVSTDGLPLGILAQQIWTRDPEERGKKHKRHSLPTEEKESNKWLKGLDESLSGIPKDVKTVTVCDREADIYDFFNKAVSGGNDFLVRVQENRRVLEEHKTLISEIKSQPVSGEIFISIPRDTRNNRKTRDVRLSVKHCSVTVRAPKNRADSSKLPNLNLYAILVEEVNPLEKVQPISWLLLTSLPILSLDDAIEKVRWYKERWKIERYHLTLKSGCTVEELQLETKDRLQTALTIYSIIAWRILWLRYESEKNSEAPCDIVLKISEWQSLYCMLHKTPIPPKQPPTLKEAVIMIAKLGGFLARKGDGEPGVEVIWRGMSRLNDISPIWAITHSQPLSIDVGNE